MHPNTTYNINYPITGQTYEQSYAYDLVWNDHGRMPAYLIGRPVYRSFSVGIMQPDNYIQAPGNSQNFNRYSYCLNNPLKYTDPSGEIFGSAFTGTYEFFRAVNSSINDFVEAVFVDGGLEFWHKGSGEAWAEFANDFNVSWAEFDPTNPGTKFNNAVKIDAGLFLHIPGWETPQTILGNLFSHARNFAGKVDNVEINRGTVLVNNEDPSTRTRWGVSLGPYINSKNLEIEHDMYLHEYGHTIQSKILGPLYLVKVGLPSLITVNAKEQHHDICWYEVWANRLASVPLSNNYPRSFRENGFDYWFWIVVMPFFPE